MAKKASKAKAAKVPATVEEAAAVVAAGKERISMWRRIGEAYRDGYAVGRKGRDAVANPFDPAKAEEIQWGAWDGGYADGVHAFVTKPKRKPKAVEAEAAA